MEMVIIENIIKVLSAGAIMLLSVLATWLTAKLGKKTELQAINTALQEAISMAEQTVGELEQTVVPKLKEANADGKLSKDDISNLNDQLVALTLAKMTAPAQQLLESAAVDVVTLIRGAGESWINKLKRS